MSTATMENAALALSLLGPEYQDAMKTFGAYSFEWLPIGSSATRTSARAIVNSDADFVGILATAMVTDNSAPPVFVANPLFTIDFKIADKSPFVDREVALLNFAGTGSNPSVLPLPWFWTKNTTVIAFLTNLSNVVFNARVSILGFHIYDGVASGRRTL